MKRYLLMFVLLTGTGFAGKSQTTDTLCFPIPVIQNLLIAAKQKKVQDTLINLLRNDVSILSQSIRSYQIKDSANKEIVGTFQAMIGTMEQQRSILEDQINNLEKEVRKWKRKTTFTAIGGVLLTGLTAFLFITK